PLLKHIAGHGRLRRPDLVDVVEKIQVLQARFFPRSKLVYLPREANRVADYLAGEASKHTRDHSQRDENNFCVDISEAVEFGILEKALVFGFSVGVPATSVRRPVTVLNENPHWTGSWAELLAWLHQHTNHQYQCLRYLVMAQRRRSGLMVSYCASAPDDTGRIYGQGVCAQRLPRDFRLLLYGGTHVEIDMIGAFYELARRVAQNKLGLGGGLPYIVVLRAQLARWLGGAVTTHDSIGEVVKRWPLVALNGSEQQLIAWVHALVKCHMPHALLELSRTIRNVGIAIRRECEARARGSKKQEPSSIFHALEQLEVGIMSDFLEVLRSGCTLSSCVWLHDGLWVYPPPTESLLQVAEALVLRKWDLVQDQPLFSVRNLQSKRARVVRELQIPPSSMGNPDLLANLIQDPVRGLLLPVEWHNVQVSRRVINTVDSLLLDYLRKIDRKQSR
ncbi:MAG: hypothetical protein AAGJ35_10255, partial [Myxococcota bacterium]